MKRKDKSKGNWKLGRSEGGGEKGRKKMRRDGSKDRSVGERKEM